MPPPVYCGSELVYCGSELAAYVTLQWSGLYHIAGTCSMSHSCSMLEVKTDAL